MKYKVGDKVRIKSIDWYNQNKASDDEIRCYPSWFGKEHSKWCGKVMTISHVRADHYTMVEDLVGYWTDEMIEGLVEEEMKSEDGLLDEYEELTDRAFKGGYEKCKSDIELNGFQLPDGYIFKDENGNVINATKIVFEKKKKEYPKTYEECYKIMGVKLSDCYIQGYKSPLLEDLQELLICRDAYWKLYGEEMGLQGPWEPDWSIGYFTPAIIYRSGFIQKVEVQYRNAILAFPTEKMRDKFYENFKELIESCKEFL